MAKRNYREMDDHDLLVITAERVSMDLPEVKKRLKQLNSDVLEHSNRLTAVEITCLERSDAYGKRLMDVETVQKSRTRQAAYTLRDISLAAGIIIALLKGFSVF